MNSESTFNIKDQHDSLNLESDQLDPLAVLIADIETIRIPEPKAKTYNNLDEYEKKSGVSQLGLIVKDGATSSSPSSSILYAGQAAPVSGRVFVSGIDCEDRFNINRKKREEELKKTLVPNVRFQKRDQKSVLSIMNSDVTGPLSFLFKCIGQQVKVVIRRRKIIYHHHDQIAHIYGSLVAFDKHYNLILSDVIEKIAIIQSEDVNCPADLPKHVRRHLKTIFIRGSNVLTVSLDSTAIVN